jgi:hypothetical protein
MENAQCLLSPMPGIGGMDKTFHVLENVEELMEELWELLACGRH